MSLEELKKTTEELDKRVAQVEEQKKQVEQEQKAAVVKSTYPVAGNRTGSDEQRALMFFGCNHVKDLLNVNTGSPIYKHVPAELKSLVRELKANVDISRMISQIFYGEEGDTETRTGKVKGILSHPYGRSILSARLKSFGSTTPGAGDEWVPTAISSQYIEEYELERLVANKFRSVNMPTNPFELPVQTDVTKARIQAENATKTDANFGTGKLTFSATKLCEFMILPEELNEDSAPQILSLIRQDVVDAQGRAIESAILNGDDSAVHMDNDTAGGAADLADKAWKGLRKLALDNSANGSTIDFSGAAVDLTKLRNMRAAMGKYGVNPRELAWIVSPKVYTQMMKVDQVTTVDKFGSMATVLQGALSALDGIPILISEYGRDDVDATGVNSGAGPNTFSTILLVNHRRLYLGVRRPIKVRAVADPTPPNDRWLIASWWRGDYKGHTQSASEVSVALGYNVA